MQSEPRRRPYLRPLLIAVGIFAVMGATMSFLLFGRWTTVSEAETAEAERLLDAAASAAGGGTPYIEIAADGTVVVHHEQESVRSPGFGSLNLMAWIPAERRILRVEYPHWFVRLKTMSTFNLGTMIAAARRDWAHLGLSIDYDDLRRRGPGLLLDNRSAAGVRLLLWSE